MRNLINIVESHLTELFDRTAENVIEKRGMDWSSQFVIDGVKYGAQIRERKGKSIMLFMSFDTDGEFSLSLTGKGNALAVMSTVASMAEQYIEEMQPGVFTFSAGHEEPSRVRLYDRMVKRIAAQFPDYRLERGDQYGNVFWNFHKGVDHTDE